MAPRAPTAYFIFAGEHRTAIHEEIAAANNGKASVALVGKAIGEKWKQLTEEEKQKYKDMAAEKARELKEQAAAAGEAEAVEGEEQPAAGPSTGPASPPFGFPASLIKKIACMDSDVDRMSADAVKAISKATALFVELLAAKSLNHASLQKRKNFKFTDIEAVAKKDRRMVDMGLPELFEKDAVFEDVRTRVAEEAQTKRGRKPAAEKEEEEGKEKQTKKKMKPLTAFFNAAGNGRDGAPPAAAAGAAAEEEEEREIEEEMIGDREEDVVAAERHGDEMEMEREEAEMPQDDDEEENSDKEESENDDEGDD